MVDAIRSEVVSILAMSIAASIFYMLGLARQFVTGYLAQRAGNVVVGAVTRAAGLAMELQRQGLATGAALDAGVRYVEQAVPAALAKTGATGHLPQMIEGQIGVLRAGATQNAAARGAGAAPVGSATPAGG